MCVCLVRFHNSCHPYGGKKNLPVSGSLPCGRGADFPARQSRNDAGTTDRKIAGQKNGMPVYLCVPHLSVSRSAIRFPRSLRAILTIAVQIAAHPPGARAASSSRSDREPSRLAAHRNTPRCSKNQPTRKPWGPQRAGTARGPVRLAGHHSHEVVLFVLMRHVTTTHLRPCCRQSSAPIRLPESRTLLVTHCVSLSLHVTGCDNKVSAKEDNQRVVAPSASFLDCRFPVFPFHFSHFSALLCDFTSWRHIYTVTTPSGDPLGPLPNSALKPSRATSPHSTSSKKPTTSVIKPTTSTGVNSSSPSLGSKQSPSKKRWMKLASSGIRTQFASQPSLSGATRLTASRKPSQTGTNDAARPSQ
jgi:hypothetical protein